MAKTVKKIVKSAQKLDRSVQVPALLGLALLVLLLAILPWLSRQNGSAAFQALQISVAILLAMAGGVCVGVQIATTKKK